MVVIPAARNQFVLIEPRRHGGCFAYYDFAAPSSLVLLRVFDAGSALSVDQNSDTVASIAVHDNKLSSTVPSEDHGGSGSDYVSIWPLWPHSSKRVHMMAG